MRPDEHKRKKNEAYKRKHGITSASNEGKHNKESTEKTKGGKTRQSFDNVKSDNDRKHEQISKGNKRFGTVAAETSYDESNKLYASLSESESNDKDVDMAKGKTKTYRKRQIVSNWQKYELEPSAEDTNVTSRGENFHKLVSIAGNALSHFRFKDELEWEQDVNVEDMKNSSQLLTIDPGHLAQSLSCIPVHKVLGITADVFTLSQIEEMMEDAEINRKKCLSCDQEEVHENVHDVHRLAKNIQSSENREKNKSNHTLVHPENVALSKKNTTKDDLKVTIESHQSHAITSSRIASNCDVETKNFNCLSIKDEELDLLLGIDRDTLTESEISLQDKAKEKTILENTKENVIVSSNLEDNLEDWLDSILDA